MTLLSSLRRLRDVTSSRPAKRRRPSCRPWLEVLEDRTVLSQIVLPSQIQPASVVKLSNALATAVTKDSVGSIFLTGFSTSDTVKDSFVAKYDSSGSEVWSTQFTAAQAFGIAADASGEYVVGHLDGSGTAFVRKYDPNGAELWTRQFNAADLTGIPPSAVGTAYGVSVNAAGVYVVGELANYGCFIRMYDANGTGLWAQKAGNLQVSVGHVFNVATDNSSVYIGGLSYPPGNPAGLADAFVSKYDLGGNEVWTRQMGTYPGGGYGLAADASGVYAGGLTNITLPGQPAIDGAPSTTVRSYLQKYDAAGNEVWTKEYGARFDESPLFSGIAVNATGIYVSSKNYGFVQKCDLNGNEIWALALSSPLSNEVGYGIVADSSGLFVAGSALARISVAPIVTAPHVVYANGVVYAGSTFSEGTTGIMEATATHLSGSSPSPSHLPGASFPLSGFTYTWTATKDGQVFDGFAPRTDNTRAIDFMLPDDGTYVFTVTASDSDGTTSAPATTTITVLNSPPSVQILSPPSTAPVGTLLAFGSSVADGPADRQHGFSYTWSVTEGGVPYSLSGGTVTNAAEFSFMPTTEGHYVVTLMVADKDGGTATATTSIDVTILDATSLQNAIYAFRSVTVQIDSTQINTVVSALQGVVAPIAYGYDDQSNLVPIGVIPLTVTLDLTSGDYHDVVVSLQPDVTLIINGVDGGTTIVGHSPALTVSAGNVIVNHVTFTTATDAPTILVSGGQLTLRDDVIQESTGFKNAAISVTGGTVDLGTATDPGGNILNINGTGQLISNTGANPVSALGDTFEVNGAAVTDPFKIENLIYHALDAGGGLVTYVAGNVYVTANSGSIQRGVNAVASGGVVNVGPGAYTGYNAGAKPLTIQFLKGPSLTQAADPDQPGALSLTVHGWAAGDDKIQFNPGDNAGTVSVSINRLPRGTFAPTGRLIAYGGAGLTDISVDDDIRLSAWLFAGAGNTRLKGGAGNNVLVGGAGTDELIGGKGRDLMIGGSGASTLRGNGGDDILISGYTVYDANDAALWAIMAEWTSADSFTQRVADLSDATSSVGFANRRNGNYFLIADATVFNDPNKDKLHGGAGDDWLFADAADKIDGLTRSDDLTLFP